MTGQRMTVNVINEADLDALAEVSVTWGDEQKTEHLPLAVSRPLLKISPNGRGAVDIIYQGVGFPLDRESYLLLNVLDVPMTPRDPNVLQIALRHRFKLFYRPALKETLDDAMGALGWEIPDGGRAPVAANNPSPYYLTLTDIEAIDRNQRICGKSIEHLMISPFSTSTLELENCAPVELNFNLISDAGNVWPYRVELTPGRSNVGLRRR